MVVDTALEGVEQGGLAVEPAADNESDADGDAQAGDAAGVGQIEFHFQGGRRFEGHGAVVQGPIIDAGAARQHALMGDEGDEVSVGQLAPQGIGVFGGFDIALDTLGVVVLIE